MMDVRKKRSACQRCGRWTYNLKTVTILGKRTKNLCTPCIAILLNMTEVKKNEVDMNTLKSMAYWVVDRYDRVVNTISGTKVKYGMTLWIPDWEDPTDNTRDFIP